MCCRFKEPIVRTSASLSMPHQPQGMIVVNDAFTTHGDPALCFGRQARVEPPGAVTLPPNHVGVSHCDSLTRLHLCHA